MCGDLATDPLGLAILLGLGYRDFSVAPVSIPEARELLGTVSASELTELCANLGDPERVLTVRDRVSAYLDEVLPFERSRLSE